MTHRIAAASLTAVVVCLALSIEVAHAALGTSSPIGINTAGFSYFSTQIPFKNVIAQQAAGWQLRGSTKKVEQWTADGYPLVWDTTAGRPYVWIFLASPTYPAGPWVLLYDGEGDFSFTWDARNAVKTREGRYTFTAAPSGSAMEIDMVRTNRQNPIHNLRLVQAQYENDYQTEPWFPPLTDLCKEFGVLRFMEWMGASSDTMPTGSDPGWGAQYRGVRAATTTTVTLDTNASTASGAYVGMILQAGNDGYRQITAYNGASRTATVDPAYAAAPTVGGGYYVWDYLNREWADRCRPDELFQNGLRGMSVELLVDVCNRTNCAPWFCMPTAASDDYLRQFATYVRDHLNPNLRIYLEWSNEAWNFSYPGWVWSDALGRRVGVGGFAGYPAYRMVQMFKIWDDVFSEPHLRSQRATSRLVRLLSVQTGWIDRAMQVLDFDGGMVNAAYPNPIDAGHKAADYADAMAMTNYIGEGVGDVKTAARNMTMDQMFDSLTKEIDVRTASTAPTGSAGANYWYLSVVGARQRGLNSVTYESGVSLYNSPFDSIAGVRLDAMETSPRMKDLYLHCLNKWKALGPDSTGKGATLWCQYIDTRWDMGSSGQWGHWGIRQHPLQPIDSCPKWQALREFSQANERWWTDVPLPQSANATCANRLDAAKLGIQVSARRGGVSISYQTNADITDLSIAVLDLDGRMVQRLVNGRARAGSHVVVWNSARTASGVYVCRISAGSCVVNARVTVTH
jgi:hypothetical protein